MFTYNFLSVIILLYINLKNHLMFSINYLLHYKVNPSKFRFFLIFQDFAYTHHFLFTIKIDFINIFLFHNLIYGLLPQANLHIILFCLTHFILTNNLLLSCFS